jgi:hypothetical protein
VLPFMPHGPLFIDEIYSFHQNFYSVSFKNHTKNLILTFHNCWPTDIPITWINRTNYYAEHIYQHRSHQYLSIKQQQQPDELANSNSNNFLPNYTLKVIDNEKILPSPFGNFISSKEKEKQLKNNANKFKLICYYTSPGDAKNSNWYLSPKDIDPTLCTHLNVGVFLVQDCEIFVEDYMKTILEEMKVLKKKNDNLKILIWVSMFARFAIYFNLSFLIF